MERIVIDTDKTAKALGSFSKAVKINKAQTLIFVSGHTGRTKDGPPTKGDIRDQTRQTFENIKYVLEASGATLRDVVKMTTFLTNKGDYLAYNEVRREYFKDDPPASSTVVVKELVAEGLVVEVEVIAAL